jgi:hypothetical protein
MPQLHQRGVDLLLNLMDAEDHFDAFTRDELRHLIGEAVVVFGQLLDRDMPAEPVENLNSAASDDAKAVTRLRSDARRGPATV